MRSMKSFFDRDRIIYFLRDADAGERRMLYATADTVRRECVGDGIHLRALLNISNCCDRACLYCGLRAGNKNITRYRLDRKQIVDAAGRAAREGYGTVVMQSGEDPVLTPEFISSIIREIVSRHDMAVTLSLGERPREVLRQWYDDGASRYLLKHETSDLVLYGRLHPGMSFTARMEMLSSLKEIGYQAGSGVMIGLPGQTWESLAGDIMLFRDLDVDMIGCGPYIANPHTPLGGTSKKDGNQVSADEQTVLTVTALNRLVTGDTHIAATTATKTLYSGGGLYRALRSGANVVMPDVTPSPFRDQYLIYPGKEPVDGIAGAAELRAELKKQTGLEIAGGRGDRVRCHS